MSRQASGKDLSMYMQGPAPGLEGPHSSSDMAKRAKSSSRYAANTDSRRSGQQAMRKSSGRTPMRDSMRESVRTIDDTRVNRRENGGRLSKDDESTASDARLTKLITDYRRENERCTSKINELKQKLSE